MSVMTRGVEGILLLLVALPGVARPGSGSRAAQEVPPRPQEQAASTWQAGVARVAITPTGPIWLSGYASRRRPAEGTLHDLWAKALALESADGQRALLITLDLIGLDRGTAQRMRRGLQRATGVSEAGIALACSHTHTGPVVGENLRPTYDLPDAEWARIDAYTDRLVRKVVDVGTSAFEDLEACTLRRGGTSVAFSVNRRENKEAEVPGLRTAGGLQGPVDHDVPLLVVDSGKEAPKAVVFGYACHATVLSILQVSGDYPGFAQIAVERQLAGTQAMFWAGCGADVNPLPRRTVELAREYGEELAEAVVDALSGPFEEVAPQLRVASARLPLPFQADGHPAYPYPIRRWQLGNLDWVFLGGEVVVDYALRIKDELGARDTWVAAYTDDVMGYIPSERVLREGGYEGGGSGVYYGLPSPWRSGLEQRIVDVVRDLSGRRETPRLAVACFAVDVTPPLGSPLCDGLVAPAASIADRLEARGAVLYPAAAPPVVLCALDWVGVGNTGLEAFREALAAAVGTEPGRVNVHCLHPHDAPGCDFAAEAVLARYGLGGTMFPVAFARDGIARVARAAAMAPRRSVSSVGAGVGVVERVASNRRILGEDGSVVVMRFSHSTDPAAIEAPVGVIDPELASWSLWDGDRARLFVSYYATHPQSHYGQGAVSADFVGRARRLRQQALPDVFHVHFCGASGNVAAGKFNDGDPARREELARRLAAGMTEAWQTTEVRALALEPLRYATRPVVLPLREFLEDEEVMLAALDNASLATRDRIRAARDLVFARRCKAGVPIELTALLLQPEAGRPTLALHLPGELFVEYQLAARGRDPAVDICVAAYGDYGPGYIGTEVAYGQGGYETGVVSRVSSRVEGVLGAAIGELLDVLGR